MDIYIFMYIIRGVVCIYVLRKDLKKAERYAFYYSLYFSEKKNRHKEKSLQFVKCGIVVFTKGGIIR